VLGVVDETIFPLAKPLIKGKTMRVIGTCCDAGVRQGPVLCSRDVDVTLSRAGDRSVEPGVTSINCLAFLHTTHNNKEYIHLAFNYLPFVNLFYSCGKLSAELTL
jgi:hypothetical protein